MLDDAGFLPRPEDRLPMRAHKLLAVSLSAFVVATLPAKAAHALLVKVSINFGPTTTGPDDGTLIVAANPGDFLRITWALGTDTDIQRYRGITSGVDTTEISRDVGSSQARVLRLRRG